MDDLATGYSLCMIINETCRALNAYVQPSMATSATARSVAPKAASGSACTGNERRLVAGISSFAFQVKLLHVPLLCACCVNSQIGSTHVCL